MNNKQKISFIVGTLDDTKYVCDLCHGDFDIYKSPCIRQTYDEISIRLPVRLNFIMYKYYNPLKVGLFKDADVEDEAKLCVRCARTIEKLIIRQIPLKALLDVKSQTKDKIGLRFVKNDIRYLRSLKFWDRLKSTK